MFPKAIKRIPAGLMIIPMFLGILFNTFCPDILNIGSFTTAVFSNSASSTIMGLQLFCIGSQLRIKDLTKVCFRGMGLLITKIALGLIIALVIGKGTFLGISALAMICAISNVNGSIYLSLVTTYGDEIDGATVPLLSLTNGPMLPLLILGMAGLADYPMSLLVATIAPTLLGMILGNLFNDARSFLRPGIQLLLPFIGFSLGAAMNLNKIKGACVEGILLSCIVIPVGGLVTYLIDKRVLRRPGYAGLSSCATGANAVAVPAAIALADFSWEVSASAAATQLATASIIGAIIIPLVVGLIMRHKESR